MNVPPDCRNRPGCCCSGGPQAEPLQVLVILCGEACSGKPAWPPAQAPAGQLPCPADVAEHGGGLCGSGNPLVAPAEALRIDVVVGRGDEQPGLHRGRQPGEVHGPDRGPVPAVGRGVSGERVTRAGKPQPPRGSGRHRARRTGDVVGEVVLHPHPVPAGGHDGRIGRSRPGARIDEDPGLGPRLGARAQREVGFDRQRPAALQRGDPDGQAAVPGQGLVDEVEAVGDRLAVRAGRDVARLHLALSVHAGHRVVALRRPGQGNRGQCGRDGRGEQGDDPAAHGAELCPLGAQHLREAVVPGLLAGAVRRDRRGHRASCPAGTARNSTASLVSSM